MTTPQPDPVPNDDHTVTDSSDTIIIFADGPEDTTHRPLRPNIPRGWPDREVQPAKTPTPDQPQVAPDQA